MVGVDYSQDAIELARKVLHANDVPDAIVHLIVGDVASRGFTDQVLSEKFDLVHDKGTYDAVSLCSSDARLEYIISIRGLLSVGGIFMITSCNWTMDELMIQFTKEGRSIDSRRSMMFGPNLLIRLLRVAFHCGTPEVLFWWPCRATGDNSGLFKDPA